MHRRDLTQLIPLQLITLKNYHQYFSVVKEIMIIYNEYFPHLVHHLGRVCDALKCCLCSKYTVLEQSKSVFPKTWRM